MVVKYLLRLDWPVNTIEYIYTIQQHTAPVNEGDKIFAEARLTSEYNRMALQNKSVQTPFWSDCW